MRRRRLPLQLAAPANPGGGASPRPCRVEQIDKPMHNTVAMTPIVWIGAPIATGTMMLADVTTDPWARMAEYGVMGTMLAGLAWWTLYRQKQTDATSKEQTTAILDMTKASVAAQTACNSTMQSCHTAITEVSAAIDRSTDTMRSVETTALENRSVIQTLCEKIGK